MTSTVVTREPELVAPAIAEPELDEAGKVLLAAADLIEEHGLAKFTTHDPDTGSYCVGGALFMAMGYQHNGRSKKQDSFGNLWEPYALWGEGEAWRRLGAVVGTSRHEVHLWNNAAERTKEEVVAALREAAHAS